MYGFGMGLGWIIPLIVIGAIIYFFVNQKNSDNGTSKSAQDILDERYAKGEINEEEYQEKRDTLKNR